MEEYDSLHRKSQRLTLTDSLAKEGLWTYFSRKLIIPKKTFFCKEILQRRYCDMAVHHGGKVSSAAKKLASKSTSNSAKSAAGKTLANHKAKCH